MRSAKSTGRIVGVLLFLQLAGLIVPFVFLLPLTAGPQSYLANAAGAAFQIRLAVFLLFANCALTIGIAISAFRVFRQQSEVMALWLLAASGIMFVLQAIDNVQVLSMLSLSRQFAQAGGSDGLFLTLATVVASTRRWAHYSELVAIELWIFLFYAILYRSTLVPRVLAGFGLLTVVLHFTGVPLMALLGRSAVTPMAASIALSHIALGTWLLARGFRT